MRASADRRKFDLAKYWSASTKRFEASVYRSTATLRASPLGLRRLQSFSPAVAEAALRTAIAPDADGWIRLTIPIESVEDAARELLRLGAETEVLEPVELRELLKSATARLAAIYSAPTGQGVASAAIPARSRRPNERSPHGRTK